MMIYLLLLLSLLYGCVPIVAITTAGYVGYRLNDERGIVGSMYDNQISKKVKQICANGMIGNHVFNREVLLTGFVDDQHEKDKIYALVQKIENINGVINAIQVKHVNSADLRKLSIQDSKLKASIYINLFKKKNTVKTRHFMVVIFDGNAHVMGTTDDPDEMYQMIGIINATKCIKEARNYVKIKNPHNDNSISIEDKTDLSDSNQGIIIEDKTTNLHLDNMHKTPIASFKNHNEYKLSDDIKNNILDDLKRLENKQSVKKPRAPVADTKKTIATQKQPALKKDIKDIKPIKQPPKHNNKQQDIPELSITVPKSLPSTDNVTAKHAPIDELVIESDDELGEELIELVS